ncbi:uncharacterized protein LOC130015521 [Mercurialis annua]|uniref:uncharacterized protein LOC130015521 n=1 Tax=Mercurialis annua TaxID=3986 RepID=UPI0024AD41D1|nr:uncharacterized protein LOC130015521 [Mercurialis annua]
MNLVREDELYDSTSRKLKNSNVVFAFNIKILNRSVRSYPEKEAMDLIMRQSRLEYESRNCGMVAIVSKSRRLKCVKLRGGVDADAEDGRQGKKRRVGEKESCSVCLEELEDFAAGMPCGHLFRGICIYKWLENSHYCPLIVLEFFDDRRGTSFAVSFQIVIANMECFCMIVMNIIVWFEMLETD